MYETCRICDRTDETVTEPVESYLEHLETLTQVKYKLEADSSTKLCEECVKRLVDAVGFRDLCIRSEQANQNFDCFVTGRSMSPESMLLMRLRENLSSPQSEFVRREMEELGFENFEALEETFQPSPGWALQVRKKRLSRPWKKPGPKSKKAKIEVVEMSEPAEMPVDVWNEDFEAVIEQETVEKGKRGRRSKKHPEGPPYICECGKSYEKRSGYFTHHWNVHKNAGMTFMCDTCGRQYKKSAQLREHLNSHLKVPPFQCDICKQRFSRKPGLVNHMFVHTGTKRYFCKFCPKAFTFYSDIKRHETSHTGVFIYNCEICHKGFNRKKHLVDHQREHMGMKVDSS